MVDCPYTLEDLETPLQVADSWREAEAAPASSVAIADNKHVRALDTPAEQVAADNHIDVNSQLSGFSSSAPLSEKEAMFSEGFPKQRQFRARFSVPDGWSPGRAAYTGPPRRVSLEVEIPPSAIPPAQLSPGGSTLSSPSSWLPPSWRSSHSRGVFSGRKSPARLISPRKRHYSNAEASTQSARTNRTTWSTNRSRSDRITARSSLASMGFAEEQLPDPPRRKRIWICSLLGAALAMVSPMPFVWTTGIKVKPRPEIVPWLLAPWFAALLVAAFMDDRGRYCFDLPLHFWMWKQAQASLAGTLSYPILMIWYFLRQATGEDAFAAKKTFDDCGISDGSVVEAFRCSLVLFLTLCGFSWIAAIILLNYCVVLKLRMVEQHEAADYCFKLLSICSIFAIPLTLCWSFRLFLVSDLATREGLSTIMTWAAFGAIIPLVPFFCFAVDALKESAETAEEDVLEGAVPIQEAAQVARAAKWTRCTAMATKVSGISLILLFVALSINWWIRRKPASGKWYMDWILNIIMTADSICNSVLTAILSGLIGPRLHGFDAKGSLSETGRRLDARRKRDAEEVLLATAQLESLELIPVSESVRKELHEVELRLRDVWLSETQCGSSGSDAPAQRTFRLATETHGPAYQLFEEYKSRCSLEMTRMMELMQSCCAAYQILRERWLEITKIDSYAEEASLCSQTVPDVKPAAEKVEEAVLQYFQQLYGKMADATEAFHVTFGNLVEEFKQASRPSDIGLEESAYPFSIHRKGIPKVQPGPLKTRDRARAKYEEKPDGKSTWPPVAATLLDLIRTTVLFGDPYDLAVFLRFMKLRFHVVRVKNRFKDFDPEKPGGFRNVHTNVVFEYAGNRLVVEVQLHLSALFIAAKMIHGAYEVVRAETPAEVVGPPYKWTDHSLSEGRGYLVEHQDTLQSVTPKFRRASTKSEIAFSVAKTLPVIQTILPPSRVKSPFFFPSSKSNRSIASAGGKSIPSIPSSSSRSDEGLSTF